MSAAVLVVDDDRNMCEMVAATLRRRGHDVSWCNGAQEALQLLQERDFDVMLSDIRLGRGMSGLELCEQVVTNRPDLPVIVITAFGSMETAVAAIRVGAYDFINKPVDLQALGIAVDRAVRHHELNDELRRLRRVVEESRARPTDMLGNSAAIRRVLEMVERLRESEATVLVTGESGTGKELASRAIHASSARAEGPFVPINCAAVPANLLESELFGHLRGAFTDARRDRDGLLQQASGGTLFLDEIGEMPLEMQPKMLRALDEGMIRPVGSDEQVPVDVRVIAATNRDLESDVEEGRFREDLFYRINVVPIHIPPLRARGNDILLLAQHFVDQVSASNRKAVTGLLGPAAQRLLDYDWPGNVRELQNCVERAVALARFDQITVEDLPQKIRDYSSSRMVLLGDNPEDLLPLAELELRYIQRVLRAVGGNKTQAAKVLGLDRRTLYRKLERLERRE